jgi:uncharacterized protein (DUF983 family)
MDRILARREVGFSDGIAAAAEEFRQRLANLAERPKEDFKSTRISGFCPACGYGLRPRPYNYQYVLPVDKCLSCGEIWFDADELEILQALVEPVR